jgi:hypothetical protein
MSDAKFTEWQMKQSERRWSVDCPEAPGGTIMQPVSADNCADPICLVVGSLAIHGIEDKIERRARLIAAAPELLAELRNFVNGVETGMIDSPADDILANVTRRARTAIAKATGEDA